MNTKRKEKLGDLALDIAKYMITAVLLATWFKRTEQWAWYDFNTGFRCYRFSFIRFGFLNASIKSENRKNIAIEL